jgi:hypothetical protein
MLTWQISMVVKCIPKNLPAEMRPLPPCCHGAQMKIPMWRCAPIFVFLLRTLCRKKSYVELRERTVFQGCIAIGQPGRTRYRRMLLTRTVSCSPRNAVNGTVGPTGGSPCAPSISDITSLNCCHYHVYLCACSACRALVVIQL